MTFAAASNHDEANALANAKLAFGAAGVGSGLGAGLAIALLSLMDWLWPAAVSPQPVLTFAQAILALAFVVIVGIGLGCFIMFIPTFVCWSASRRMPFSLPSFAALLVGISLIIAIVMNLVSNLPPFDLINLVVMGFVGLSITLVRTRLERNA